MTLDQVLNFAKVTVSTLYAAGATSIVLITNDGLKLPDPTVTNYNLVWYDSYFGDPAEDPLVEIVRVTAKTDDTLTVTRAQEGTADTNKNTSGRTYKMVLSFTKKTYDDLSTEFVNVSGDTMTGNLTFSGAQKIIGGTGVTSDLTLQTTTGVGAAGADMHFLVGNNGATEAVTILNSGATGINQVAPSAKLDIVATDAENAVALEVNQLDAGATNAANIVNTGTGNGLFIDQNGNGVSLRIDGESTTVDCINIDASVLTTGSIAAFYSNSSDVSTRNLVSIHNDNSAAAGTKLLNVRQDATAGTVIYTSNAGTGDCLFMDQDGNGVALHIDNDGTANSITVEGTTATDFTIAKSGATNIASTLSVGDVLSVNYTGVNASVLNLDSGNGFANSSKMIDSYSARTGGDDTNWNHLYCTHVDAGSEFIVRGDGHIGICTTPHATAVLNIDGNIQLATGHGMDGGARFKTITTTHDVSITGTQAITGVGFTPSAIIIYANISGSVGETSWGFSDGTSSYSMGASNTAGAFHNTGSYIIYFIETAAGNEAYAAVTSMDADGVTLTWSKASTPTGTVVMDILFFR